MAGEVSNDRRQALYTVAPSACGAAFPKQPEEGAQFPARIQNGIDRPLRLAATLPCLGIQPATSVRLFRTKASCSLNVPFQATSSNASARFPDQVQRIFVVPAYGLQHRRKGSPAPGLDQTDQFHSSFAACSTGWRPSASRVSVSSNVPAKTISACAKRSISSEIRPQTSRSSHQEHIEINDFIHDAFWQRSFSEMTRACHIPVIKPCSCAFAPTGI